MRAAATADYAIGIAPKNIIMIIHGDFLALTPAFDPMKWFRSARGRIIRNFWIVYSIIIPDIPSAGAWAS
jgi:hypothetical protein